MTKKQIFALAAFTYLFLAPFTFHPDIKTIFYQSQFLSQGVFNIYEFFANNPDKAFLGNFVYPPLAYFLYGILFIPVRLLGGSGFVEWLGMGSDAVGVAHIFQYLFALKMSAILMYLVSGYYLIKLIDNEELQKKALLFWFFNPLSIYVVAFMGQIDAAAVLLTILALFYVSEKPVFSAFLLGVGGAIKTYPLLLIPYLAFICGKTWRDRFKYMLFGFLPYLLIVFPFLKTPSFYSSTFVSGLSQRIFEPRIFLGFGESLLIIPAILTVLFISIFKKTIKTVNLWMYFLAVTLVISVGVHFHPQWILWPLSFLTLYFVKNYERAKSEVWFTTILFFVGFIGTLVFFDDKFLIWGIISPLDEGVLFLPTILQLVKPYFDPELVQSLFHSLLIALGLGITWRSFKENV